MTDNNTTDQSGDAELIRQIVTQLDEQQAELDTASRWRLNQARQAALNAHDRRSPWRWPATPAVGMALAAVFVLALGLGWLPGPATDFAPTGSASMAFAEGLEDLELLAATDEPEMFAELDFYYWVDTGMDMGVDRQWDGDGPDGSGVTDLPDQSQPIAPAIAG